MFHRSNRVAGFCLLGSMLVAAPALGVTVTLDANSSVSGTDPGVTLTGAWITSTSTSGFIGSAYLQDGNTGGVGGKAVTYTPNLPSAGLYLVEARWTDGANRATNVPYDINFNSGSTTVVRNQEINGGQWNSLGTYNFAAGTGGNVVLRNDGANEFVIADGMRFTTFTPAVASAPQTIAIETFESYAPGSNLNGGSGGAGWTSNWSTTGGNVTVQPLTMTDPNGLSSGGAQAARIQPTANITVDDNSIAARTFGSQFGTVYVGVLVRAESIEAGDFINFQLSESDSGNAANTMGFGILNDANNTFFARAGQSGSGTQPVGPAIIEGEDYLLVAKFSKDANGEYGRVDLFINPASLIEPGTPDLTAISTQPSMTLLSRFNIRVNSVETDDIYYFDNLRISSTFAGAIAQIVPEPASLSLLVMSGAALLRRRRHAA